jgi:hypothetical protein
MFKKPGSFGKSRACIHTGFQIGQVLVVNCRVCMFLIFCRFSFNPGGGGGGRYGRVGICSLPAGPVQQRKKEWIRRGVIQGGPVQQAVPHHAPQQAGTARKAGRASTGGLKVRSVWGKGGGCTYIITS